MSPTQQKSFVVESYRKIHYPNICHYSESNCIADGKLYVPLNGAESPGLYYIELDKIMNSSNTPAKGFTRGSIYPNAFSLKFIYPNHKDVILGAKIKDGMFVGCNAYDNSLLIYHLECYPEYQMNIRTSPTLRNDPNLNHIVSGFSHKSYHYIPLTGCPNDVCFSETEPNVVYCVMNMDFETYSGVLIQVDIKTGKITYLVGMDSRCKIQQKLFPVSGLAVQNNFLFISTLPEIYRVSLNPGLSGNLPEQISLELTTIVSINENADCPFYDNITFYQDRMNIAVYDYGRTVSYGIFKNRFLLKKMVNCFSCCFGVGFLDKTNIHRKMAKNTKIKFVTIEPEMKNLAKKMPNGIFDSTTENNYTYSTFDISIPNFDKEITQIVQLSDKQYLLTNFKAGFMILITTK